MSASVQTLPVLPGTTEGLTGAATNLSLNQADGDISEGFGPILGEVFTALSESAEGTFEIPLADNPLNDLLQTLPEGGKLLPLLEQAMNEAVAAGIEPQQVVDRITDSLEALEIQPELNPAQQLAEVVRQVIQELPAMKPAPVSMPVPSQTPIVAEMLPDGDESPLQQRPAPAPETALQMAPQLSAKEAPVGKPVPDMAVEFERAVQRIEQLSVQRLEQNEGKALKLAGLEQAFERLQQQPSGEPRQADLASMMVAFKRLAAEPRGAATDVLTRSEGFAIPAAVATAVTPGAPAAAAAPASVTLNTPFGQAGWDQALGERIQWMVNQKMQGAEVKLNPAHLGPMEVRVQIQNDQASVFFSAQNGAVREALEAALPRLRDMFEASGVELVDVDVSDQSFAEQRAMQDDGASELAGGTGQDAESDNAEIHVETSLDGFVRRGILDLFA